MTESVSAAALISVVTPAYNRQELLKRSIESVIQQSFPAWELVIVDDGSTDGTVEVANQYAERDTRVRVLQQENSGAAVARAYGARESKGEFLLFLDSDDELLPGALDQFADKVQQGTKIGVVCHAAEELRADGELKRLHRPRNLGPSYENVKAMFLAGTFLVHRGAFIGCGGFPHDCRSSQHTEFSLRLLPYCVEHGFEIVNDDLVSVRVHAHEGVHLRSSWQSLYDGGRYILDKHANQLRKSPKHYSDWCMVTAVYAARLGDYREARRLFRRAVRAYPKNWKNMFRWLIACVPSVARKVWKP